MAYEPEPRVWENKQWLYEKYWGEFLSARSISDEVDSSPRVIREQMEEFGIPRRPRGYKNDGTVSPFAGFYNEDEASRSDEKDRSRFKEEKQPDGEEDWSNWNGAEENELIGKAAQFGQA